MNSRQEENLHQEELPISGDSADEMIEIECTLDNLGSEEDLSPPPTEELYLQSLGEDDYDSFRSSRRHPRRSKRRQ